ncbi:CHAT domain-containing protein [Mycena rebaudengoi]|nr:CHAT domain-containing protein [Mycena rebaudengoi]
MQNNLPARSPDLSTASELIGLAESILKDCMAENNLANLDTAIYLLAETWVDESALNSYWLNLLATALLTRFSYTGQWKDVQIAGTICNSLMTSEGSSLQDIKEFLRMEFQLEGLRVQENPADIVELAGNTLADFHSSADLSKLETAICLFEEAISGQDLAIETSGTLRQLANAHLIRFHKTGDTEEVQKSISLLRQLYAAQPNQVSCLIAALLSVPEITSLSEVLRLPTDDEEVLDLADTGRDLFEAFQQSGDGMHLDMAISTLEIAAAQVIWGHYLRTSIINDLGIALHARFKTRGDAADLDSAIGLHHEVLELRPAPHPDRGNSLTNLANVLSERFETRGDAADLDSAIGLHREALDLCPAPHPDRGGYLNNLANVLSERFETRGDAVDLDSAIGMNHEALDLCPAPHPGRGKALNNLADVLCERFQTRGDEADLDRAILLFREALDLHPSPHPDRGGSLNNLAAVLHDRFKTTGDATDLDSAITLHREALELRPAPHPDRGKSLNNLAIALEERLQTRGDAVDLDSAIELHRETLDLRPAPHPGRGTSLNNLGNVLHQRFHIRGNATDLDSAITLHREALDLWPAPHPDRGMSLSNLANVLHERFQKKGHPEDLDNAIVLQYEALDLHPASHPGRGTSLNNLGGILHERFQTRGDTKDLDSAIRLYSEALDLCPASHPDRGGALNNLAGVLHDRFKTTGDAADLDSAIMLHREALTVFQPPHPQRGVSLMNLAGQLISKSDNSLDTSNMEEAVIALRESSGYPPSPVSYRCQAAAFWARSADLGNHNSALEAYETSIEMLPQQAMLGLDLQSRQKALTLEVTIGLAADAAACASRSNKFSKAVEFLEAGRAVFWSQALQLHTSLDDLQVAHPELAERISNISKQLELGSHRAVASLRMLPAVHKDHMMLDKEDAHYRKLNAEWVQNLDQVRQQPGFQQFLKPKLINELRAAATHGPIIILNASTSGCTAWIVTLSKDVQSINLENMTWANAQMFVELLYALQSQSSMQIALILTKISPRSTLQERLKMKLESSADHDPNKVFAWLLAELWARIVQPVFYALGLKKSDNPGRIWWCPTGPLTFLPIHAAGLYGELGTDCVSDYAVSSYTPTLASLLDPPTHTASPFKMTAVIQPTSHGCSDLPGTVEELAQIKQRVPAEWLASLGDTAPATVNIALHHLRESSVVHFACHGIQDLQNPLETGLHLTNGRLKVSELMRGKSQKKTMTLAFLSACETAKGDYEVPDEAMHLAATLLFAGFRGVVATMWTMADVDGPKIAETFYEHLFKGCDANADPPILPDLTRAAKALHVAVTKLRADPNVSFRRWVPFVHYGL